MNLPASTLADNSSHYLPPNDANYPSSLRKYRHTKILPAVSAIGNLHLLQPHTLAFFCSVKCPGNLILQTYDLALALRDAGITVISGFHSPMEQECFTLILRGTQPVIYCPARSIEMRLPAEWKRAITEDRLLLLSPFESRVRHATSNLAQIRNSFVTALADTVFIAYASPGSKTEASARQVLAWGKSLLTLDSRENSNLIALGAKPVQPHSMTNQRLHT